VLDLRCSQLPEALLITHFGKLQRIEETKWFACADLLRRLEGCLQLIAVLNCAVTFACLVL
jgi:hypothetical protein